MEAKALEPYWPLLSEGQRNTVVAVAASFARTNAERPQKEDDPWLRIQDVCDYTQRSRSTVMRAIGSGDLRAHLPRGMSRGYRLRKSDVDAWMEGD